jgi:hypothetical protein
VATECGEVKRPALSAPCEGLPPFCSALHRGRNLDCGRHLPSALNGHTRPLVPLAVAFFAARLGAGLGTRRLPCCSHDG